MEYRETVGPNIPEVVKTIDSFLIENQKKLDQDAFELFTALRTYSAKGQFKTTWYQDTMERILQLKSPPGPSYEQFHRPPFHKVDHWPDSKTKLQ